MNSKDTVQVAGRMAKLPSVGRRGFLGAGAATAALVMLGGVATPTAAQADTLRLMLSSAPTTWILPYYMAQDSGWFAENGLTVEETYVQGDATAFRGLVAGNADLATMGPATLFSASLAGSEVRSVVSWQPTADYQIVARKGLVDSIDGLAGRTFASAGPSDITTEIPRMVMRKAGVDDTSVRFVQVGGHGPRLQAVAANVVEATMINTLTATMGVLDGTVDVVTSVGEHFPDIGYVLVAARDQDIADSARRDLLKIFVEGSMVGARMIMDDAEQAADIMHARVPEMDRELIYNTILMLNEGNVWGVNGIFPDSVADYTVESALEQGLIDRMIDPRDIIDNTLAEEVMERIGAR